MLHDRRVLDFDSRGFMDRAKLKYYVADVLQVCEARVGCGVA